jgi:hypothetical protein
MKKTCIICSGEYEVKRQRRSSEEPVCQRKGCVKKRQRLRRGGKWAEWVKAATEVKDAVGASCVQMAGVVQSEVVPVKRVGGGRLSDAEERWVLQAEAGVRMDTVDGEVQARNGLVRGVTGVGATEDQAMADWQAAVTDWVELMRGRQLPEV